MKKTGRRYDRVFKISAVAELAAPHQICPVHKGNAFVDPGYCVLGIDLNAHFVSFNLGPAERRLRLNLS